MLSFNSQNYVVEYKKATPQQWRGEAPKDNKLERVFGLFREPDEVNAIGTAMDVVCNFYNGQYEKDYNLRQILFYNEYGELDGVFYDFRATPESEWSEQPEDAVTQTWWVENREDTIAFYHKNSFTHGSGLEIPVPDGYHYMQFGYGLNQGWSYIVPQDVSLHANHIDAKPYSFGVTTSPVSHIAFESKNIEAYKQVFLSAGHLTPGVLVDSFTISAHCAFLYQNWYDTEDKYYNKINGFLFAGNDVYQFHIYVNHTVPIGHDENTISAFLEVGRAWMRQVALQEDKEETTYIAPTTPDIFASGDFEMDDDEEGKLTNYAGSAKNVVIPCGVEIIGENAFLMKEITSVVIPEGVTELEDSAFWGCKQLTSVKLPTTLEKIGPDAFRGCESLTSIVIPEGVWEIEADAFSFCTSLKHIYLPESLWSIGYDAFSTFCDDMKLHVPQFSSAETYAQDNDLQFDHKKPSKTASAEKTQAAKTLAKPKAEATSAAKDFIIENNKVTGYFGNATEIVIPEGVTAVATEAYIGNESTKRIVIPEGVKTLGRDAFASCGNLTEVVLPMSLTTLGGFACCSGLKQIHIPAGVKTIGPEAFSSCPGLTEIILPYGLKKISKDAFFACTSLKDVHIPETVTDIHKEAFSCATFGVTFHVCQGSIAEAFAKEQNLKIDNTLAEYAAKKPEKVQKPKATTAKKAGTKTYTVEDGKLLRYNGKAGTPSIPKDVTIIGTGAFDGSETLLCMELPETVTKVETGAFRNCPNLFRIIVPESVADIARGAFVNCPELYLDTMEGSYAAKYGAQNSIPVKTDGLYGQRPEISEKVEAARLAAAEAERIRKEEEARRQREYEERCRREAEERERKAAEEAERRRKIAEEEERYRLAVLAEKRNRYDQLIKQVADQNRIISENRGWFGAQAKARKAAQSQLATLQAQLSREFPNGRP